MNGIITLEINNTYNWYTKLRKSILGVEYKIREEEEFFVMVKKDSKSPYIKDNRNDDKHAISLKIINKVSNIQINAPVNLTPTQIGKPDNNLERYESCKFTQIAITEPKVPDQEKVPEPIIIYKDGQKLHKVTNPKESIERKILFEFDSDQISPEGKKTLDNILKFLFEHQFSHVDLKGYACVIGKMEYNQRLSQKRADAVKKFFQDSKLDISRVRAIGYGEVNPTDDTKGRDNIRYKDEKQYKEARCVFINFEFYGHDAQAIVYETIAPSANKNLTLRVSEYETIKCFRETNKHTKTIRIVSPDAPEINKMADSLSFPVHSDLSSINVAPLQYIWPKWNLMPGKKLDSASPYLIHIHSCRYYSNQKNSTVLIKVYPDIKWTLEFSYNFTNPAAYKHANLPEYNRELPKGVQEIKRKQRGAQGKATQSGLETSMMKNSPELLSYFGLKLQAEWNRDINPPQTAEFGLEFANNIFIKYKELADKVKNTLGGAAKKTPGKLPFMFEVESPSLNANIEWYLEKGTGKYSSQVATVGALNFKGDPLVGASFTLDLLALGSRIHPAIAALIAGIEGGLSALNGGITIEATFYGKLEFDFKALEINSLTGVQGGNLDLGAKFGIKINFKIHFNIINESISKKPLMELHAKGQFDAYFYAKLKIDSDDKGIYAKPELGFSGMIFTFKIEVVIRGFKRNLKLGNEKDPFLKAEVPNIDPIYLT